jgi:hypothetical protein
MNFSFNAVVVYAAICSEEAHVPRSSDGVAIANGAFRWYRLPTTGQPQTGLIGESVDQIPPSSVTFIHFQLQQHIIRRTHCRDTKLHPDPLIHGNTIGETIDSLRRRIDSRSAMKVFLLERAFAGVAIYPSVISRGVTAVDGVVVVIGTYGEGETGIGFEQPVLDEFSIPDHFDIFPTGDAGAPADVQTRTAVELGNIVTGTVGTEKDITGASHHAPIIAWVDVEGLVESAVGRPVGRPVAGGLTRFVMTFLHDF